MKFYIARAGEELGDCEQSELEKLARDGEILPTDNYWHDGMEGWKVLGDFLGEEAWKPLPEPVAVAEAKPAPKPAPKPEPKPVEPVVEKPKPEPVIAATPALAAKERLELPKPEPIVLEEKKLPSADLPPPEKPKRSFLLPIVILFALLIGLGAFFYYQKNGAPGQLPASPTPVTTPPEPIAQTAPTPLDSRTLAAQDLRNRIERLPSRAVAPLYTFYYDVSVQMTPSNDENAPWSAVIHGEENIVDPATQRTTRRTEFSIATDYENGAWAFKHYQASSLELATSNRNNVEETEDTPMPPSLVGILGLKMKGH